MNGMTLKQRVRREDRSAAAQVRNQADAIDRQRRFTDLVNRAAVAANDRWGDVRARVAEMTQERKDRIALLHPVNQLVEIARAQGAIEGLRELMAHYDNAQKEAEAYKQTMG